MSKRNKKSKHRDRSGEQSEPEYEPHPHQLEPPMRLRAVGFPHFDFKLPSMVGSGSLSSHNFGTRDQHTSSLKPSDKIDDEFEQYEVDVVEDHIPRGSLIRDIIEVPSADHHMVLLGFIETMRGVSIELHRRVRVRGVMLMWERSRNL
ncbi:unnamed protein product [Linum trigynum]|uniref:Uncharacterized protein n=1 Tax=Linum trigynum TaxID=586398 RepID=A0AAV2GQ65_9ROSI